MTAVLDMVIPSDYVQFYITGVSATDELTCNNVECWKDITINGSSLAVSSKTNAGTTMTGSKFSTNDNGIVFYGRLKSEALPTDCELSVTNNGKTYERTIAGKHLTGRTAYTIGTFSTTGANAWSLKESRPEDALSGKFSVSPTKQVYFSPGDLWADGSGNFGFEDIQVLNIKTKAPDDLDNGYIMHSSHITHFYWSTEASNAAYTGYHNYDSKGTADDVLFTNASSTTPNADFIVDGQKGIWRTLSNEEWQYLFSYDEKANDTRAGLYALGVTVNGVAKCVALYPDGYSGAKVSNNDTTSYDTEDECHAATAAGVVFLSPNGYRYGGFVNYPDSYCEYYASNAMDNTTAYEFSFNNGTINIGGFGRGSWAFSVRLVSDCE